MKETIKQIFIRSIGLTMATAFGGTALGAIAGDWLFGTLIGIGSAFAVVLTMIGVSMTWSGTLKVEDIANAYRAAVAKSAEGNESLQDALEVTKDGSFDWDDVEFEDADFDEYDPKAKDNIA